MPRRVLIGAVLLVAGIAAFIEAHSHRPRVQLEGGYWENKVGFSQTAYDLLRIGGWALVIFGALLIVVGLLSYRRGASGD